MKRPAPKYPVSALLILATFSLGSRASPHSTLESPAFSAPVQILYDHLQKLRLADSLGDVAEEAQAQIVAESDIQSDLQKLGKPSSSDATEEYRNLRELLLGTANDFLSKGWCRPREDADFDRLECLKTNFRSTVSQAKNEGAIDSIESSIYRYFLDALFFDDSGALDTDTERLWSLGSAKKDPKRNQVELPSLPEYRFRKLRLEQVRLKADPSAQARFTPDFLALLSKTYRKKVRGLCRVEATCEADALDYAIAKYSSFQLGELAGMMRDAVYAMSSSETKITGVGPDGKSWSRPLRSGDLYAYLINDLQAQVEERTTDPNSYLFRFRGDITLEDMLLASVLTAQTKPIVISTIIRAHSEFRQPKPDYAQVKSFLRDAGQTLLLTQPELLPFYLLGNIVFDTLQRNKADRKDFNNETRRVLIRNPR